MFELVYTLFFYVLIFEISFFAFLNLPSPRGWKAVVTNFLTTNPKVLMILRGHLVFCCIAAVFLYDCYRQEHHYSMEKEMARGKDSYASGKSASIQSLNTTTCRS